MILKNYLQITFKKLKSICFLQNKNKIKQNKTKTKQNKIKQNKIKQKQNK